MDVVTRDEMIEVTLALEEKIQAEVAKVAALEQRIHDLEGDVAALDQARTMLITRYRRLDEQWRNIG